MKAKILSLVFILMFTMVMAIPTLAASNSYSYTMNFRVVDGSANGKFFNLSQGDAWIEGYQRQYSSDPGAVGPNTIHYQLYNKTSGNSFGDVTSFAPTDGSNRSFSGKYTGLGGGTSYYLFIWKAADDGRNVDGVGTVSN